MSEPLVASIGTTHPWNIAGIGLDSRICADYGVCQAMAVVAVSAQDARGLQALHVIPPDVIRAQLDTLPDDIVAFRVGALVSSETVRIVADYIRARVTLVPVVVDPVIGVSLGGELRADEELLATLRDELLTLPVIVTPNAPEAALLLGMPVDTTNALHIAARRFVERGAAAAFVKGGHLRGDAVDVLVTDSEEHAFAGTRLPGSMRGGGCALAAALMCELALGRDIVSAAESARAYVRDKIAARTIRSGLQVAF